MEFTTGWLYKLCEWVMRLVYVNLLWLTFSFLGLLLLGIGPATSAMFTVIRKWILGQDDVQVFSTFWNAYRLDFWRANLLTMMFLIGGSLLYIDFLFIGNLKGWVTDIFSVVLLLLTLLYIATLTYIFPVFVHFQLKPLQYVKYAVHLGISSPLNMLIVVGSSLLMYYATLAIPAIFPFFSGSVVSLIIMQRTYKTLIKLENKYAAS